MYHYTIPTAANSTSAATKRHSRKSAGPARTVVVRPAVVKGNLSVADLPQSDDVQYSDSYRTYLNKARHPQQVDDYASAGGHARPPSNPRADTMPSSSASYLQVAPHATKLDRSYKSSKSGVNTNKTPVRRRHPRRRHRTQARRGELRGAVGRSGQNSYDAQLRAYRIRLQQQHQRKQLMTGTRSPRQPYHYYGNLPGYIPPSIGSPVPSVGGGLPVRTMGAAFPVRTVQANQPFTGQLVQPPQPAVAPYPIPVSGASYAMPQGHASMIGQPVAPYQTPRVVYVAPQPKPAFQGSAPLVVKADPYQRHMSVQPLQAPNIIHDRLAVALPGGQKRRVSLSTPSDYSWTISGFTKCSRSCGGGKLFQILL